MLVAVATHDYFNQSPPDECDASIPYHMPAIFEPFTKSSTDPVAPGTRTVAVEVSDGTLADMAPDQTICVPDPSQGVNCP